MVYSYTVSVYNLFPYLLAAILSLCHSSLAQKKQKQSQQMGDKLAELSFSKSRPHLSRFRAKGRTENYISEPQQQRQLQ